MSKVSEELCGRALAEVAVWARRAHSLSSDPEFCTEIFVKAAMSAEGILQNSAEPVTNRALSPQMAAFASEMSAQKMAMAEAIAKSSLEGIGLSERTIEELLIVLKGG